MGCEGHYGLALVSILNSWKLAHHLLGGGFDGGRAYVVSATDTRSKSLRIH